MTQSKELFHKLRHYRISQSEYELICQKLQREPRSIEWALFSALWSEHCSYKSSRVHLKKFSQTLNQTVVNAVGENAGVVDLGYGERIAFKMESHNHPSFIEPYQGAATGVGGILRDIFTMGARPIALADYLCFGEAQAPRMPSLVDGVVRGISGYGNCVGVPTVAGKTHFHSAYNQNILVNAMAVGLLRPGEQIALSKAKGVGNWIVYVGAKTGKDGVHGAAMASESFDENSEAKKPNVQIGDPFFEKLLIESCLEVIQKDLVIAIQDMGAAGLTSSSFEMASKGQIGMEIRLDEVPLRDPTMTPEEILLSESQERMLLVCEPHKFNEIQNLFARYGLDAVRIGDLREKRMVRLCWKGEVLSEIDPDILVEEAPLYKREYHETPLRVGGLRCGEQDLGVLMNENGALKKPIYQQYDQRVGTKTVRGAGSDVAFLRLPDSGRGLAISLGCRPALMKANAKWGAFDSVFYPALQMASKGARVVALTDCLNFGNPEKADVMSQFVAAVETICAVSLALQAPVISGNVSFYNETQGVNIIPTPAMGLIGIRDNVENIPQDVFLEENLSVFCLKGFSTQTDQNLDEMIKAQVAFLEGVLRLVKTPIIKTSRVVGEYGFEVTIEKMTGQGIGLQGCLRQSEVHEHFSSSVRFYDIIIAVESAETLKLEVEKAFFGYNPAVDVLYLGETKLGCSRLSQEQKYQHQNCLNHLMEQGRQG